MALPAADALFPTDPPAAPAPAAKPSAASLFPTAPAAPPKPAAAELFPHPPAAPAKPAGKSLRDRARDAVTGGITGSKLGTEVWDRNVGDAARAAQKDVQTGHPVKGAGRAAQAALGALNVIPDAAIEDPIAWAESKVPAYKVGPGGKLTRRAPEDVRAQARGGVGMALGGARAAGARAAGALEGVRGVHPEPIFHDPAGQNAAAVKAGPQPIRPPKPKAADLFPHAAPAKPAAEALFPVEKGGRPKVAAAAREHVAPDELHAPEPHEHGAGPVVGTEADPVERLDNAFYRLQGHATADKVEAKQFLERLPAEFKAPGVQEELYHAIEAKLANPKAQIPEHLKPAFEAMTPWYREQTDIANRLRERGLTDQQLDDLELYDHDQGYVARRVQGHTPIMDEIVGDKPRDPIMGGRSLFKTSQAQKQRTGGFIATDKNGVEHFYRGKVPETDIKDRPWKSQRQATTKEIEANTDLRYHKNALANTVDNVLRLRRVERNLQVLDETTNQLKEAGLAHQVEWHYRQTGDDGKPTGPWIRGQANERAPSHFVEVHSIPQLKGWKFDPKVANVLKDYHPEPGQPLWEVLGKVNRMLTASLFITPVPHAANVMAHWAVGRGWDWINPRGYQRLMRTSTQAAKEVLTLGPKYRQMLREGSALLYGDTTTKDFHKLLLDKAGREVTEDPKALATLAKAAGMPVAVVKAAYGASNKMLWAIGDFFMLQRQLELEQAGMSARKAIKEAERDIPNYRVPPEVFKQRWISQAIQNPNVLMFGRYKYGQLRAWGEMFKDLGNYKNPKAQVEALGKFVAAMTISQVLYPLMDQAVQHATGNKDARMHRAGPFSLTDSATQAATGQKDLAMALSSFLNISPLASEGVDLKENHDFFGRPIRTPGAPAWFQGAEAGKYLGESALYPVQLGVEALQGKDGAERAGGKLVGVDVPPPGSKEQAAAYRAKDKRKGARAVGRFKERLADGRLGEAIDKMGR